MDKITLTTFNNKTLNYRKFVFSGGEIQVRLDSENVADLHEIIIRADLRTASGIMEMFLITDALRRAYPNIKLHASIPYLPYARQDRVCAAGEAFSLEVMCNLINVMNYASVMLWDVHSPVSLKLLNNSFSVPICDLIPESVIGNTILVSPDKGACERVMGLSDKIRRPMIVAEKVRDPNDGKITGTKIADEYMELINSGAINCDGGFFIADDICDGGRTFIELAKVLRPMTTGKIKLYVTHLIASQGFDVFNGLVDEIYTSNSFHDDVPAFVHIV